MLINDFDWLICVQFSCLVNNNFLHHLPISHINNLFFATSSLIHIRNISKNSLTSPTEKRRYKILCIKKLIEPITPEKATKVILEHLNMEEDRYRIGATKVLNHTVFVSMSSCVHYNMYLKVFQIAFALIHISFENINFTHQFHHCF